MSLRDKLEALPEANARTNGCRVHIVRALLTPEENAELDTMLADRYRYPGARLAKVLAKRDPKVTGDAVRRHRTGGCNCSREGYDGA